MKFLGGRESSRNDGEAMRNLSKTSPSDVGDSRQASKESTLEMSRTSSKELKKLERKTTKKDFFVGSGDVRAGFDKMGGRKKKRKRSKENIVYITVPESVMLGYNPRTSMPWGFDAPCSDGQAKFLVPPGFEFDHSLDERVHDLNLVQKPHLALVNLVSLAIIGLLVYLCVVWGQTLAPMTILVALADVVTVLVGFVVFISVRYWLKGMEIQNFINRLNDHLSRDGRETGCVHFENLQYSRWGVWDAAFVGLRSGFTQRTAIACELFLDDPEGMISREREFKEREQKLESLQQNMATDTDTRDFFREKKEREARPIDPDRLLDPAAKTNEVIAFLQDIHLVRLAPMVRRTRLTFADMERMTDLDWRTLGVDRTERKLIRNAIDARLEEDGLDTFSAPDAVNLTFNTPLERSMGSTRAGSFAIAPSGL